MSRGAEEFYGMDHAMVFSTGYQANLGIISTIAGKGDYIILDIDSHASIWDGCKMGDAEVVPFKHNDIEAMEKRLRASPKARAFWCPRRRLFDAGRYCSAEGDDRHRQEVWRDGAGGRGALDGLYRPQRARRGRGAGLLDDVDFVIGTFSKSVGTVGGFCVSNHPKFEIMRLVCRPYVFTAAAALVWPPRRPRCAS
jgi:glycine C-acetyltransferase/8-amino-7-oxononanoate synthase